MTPNLKFILATKVHHIYITKKETLSCLKCKRAVNLGQKFVADSEQSRGYCFNCSPFKDYTFLPSGDAALTRRSKKHSYLCGAVMTWNQRRKRYERKGQYVEASAIEKARIECQADEGIRLEKNKKAAVQRAIKDGIYIEAFAKAIRQAYPNCPVNREVEIANHACEKHSGRVGRTASAKQFDKNMIDRAVEAHIRHKETNYDNQFGQGKRKREIRSNLKFDIVVIMQKWRHSSTSI